MWVPGPGVYLLTGPRSWPGMAIECVELMVLAVCGVLEVASQTEFEALE
jgi:hypothetical protein